MLFNNKGKGEKTFEKINIYVFLLGILIIIFIFTLAVLVVRASQTYEYFQNIQTQPTLKAK